MFGDILSGSRLILVGLVFFVLVVGGSLLYSWHVQRTSEAELEQHDQLSQGLENENATRSAQSVNLRSETDENFIEGPKDSTETDTKIPEETAALPIDAELLGVTEDAPTEEVQVSPFGFGPYPKLPEGWEADFPPVSCP